MKISGDVVVLIDGDNWIDRSRRAGDPTPALCEQVANRLESIERHYKPRRVAIAISSGSWRTDASPGYAPNRNLFAGRWPVVDKLAGVALEHSVDVLRRESFEAGDLMATATRCSLEAGFRVVVASSDRVLHQVLTPDAVVQMVGSGRESGRLVPQYFSHRDLVDRYGVSASQWVDWLTLVGRPTDGIPGCPGVGENTASLLLKRCGSLGSILNRCHTLGLRGPIADSLMKFRRIAREIRRLHRLRADAPIPADWIGGAAG